jgi:hypothetical protein
MEHQRFVVANLGNLLSDGLDIVIHGVLAAFYCKRECGMLPCPIMKMSVNNCWSSILVHYSAMWLLLPMYTVSIVSVR